MFSLLHKLTRAYSWPGNKIVSYLVETCEFIVHCGSNQVVIIQMKYVLLFCTKYEHTSFLNGQEYSEFLTVETRLLMIKNYYFTHFLFRSLFIRKHLSIRVFSLIFVVSFKPIALSYVFERSQFSYFAVVIHTPLQKRYHLKEPIVFINGLFEDKKQIERNDLFKVELLYDMDQAIFMKVCC